MDPNLLHLITRVEQLEQQLGAAGGDPKAVIAAILQQLDDNGIRPLKNADVLIAELTRRVAAVESIAGLVAQLSGRLSNLEASHQAATATASASITNLETALSSRLAKLEPAPEGGEDA